MRARLLTQIKKLFFLFLALEFMLRCIVFAVFLTVRN
ncbi:hypothetical protein SAMN04488121_103726 [Chitinophaga filiformis]|uniref:Uncharacterized protein n=1 Tax=Chitinophaga filiformis TaxID=104663 RepID=A0A1G7S3Y9_CHIFI|nr:hypothetical protein SAMN04488121_103726 [Chitinophaga filiformis]